jgi:hypothetical protein
MDMEIEGTVSMEKTASTERRSRDDWGKCTSTLHDRAHCENWDWLYTEYVPIWGAR